MKSFLLTSLLLSFLCLIVPIQVFACSCGGRPSVLEAFDYSKVVVAGRIESVQRLRPDQRERDIQAILSATLVIDKVYKGDVKAGDQIILAQGGGSDCGLEWSESNIGEKLLLYLGEPSETNHERALGETINGPKQSMYRTSFCGRSNGLNSAAEDLAYLDNLEKLKGKTRISGELSFSSDDDRSVEGIEVLIKGKKSQFKTKYLKAGFFEIYDVPPGEYVIEVKAPRGWKVGEHWRYTYDYSPADYREGLGKNERRIRIDKGGHVGLDLALIPDTNISGRVLSPTGRPMVDVSVVAMPVGDKKAYLYGHASTNKDGIFTFEALTPGTYRLVLNNEGKIDAEKPFGRLFYPGVPNEADAGLVYVEPGRYNSRLEIQIPQIQRLIEISGRFEFADGQPVGEGWVKFKPENGEGFGSANTRTDTDGKFTLKIPFGAAGTITAEKYFWKDDYSCPQIVTARETAKSNDLESVPISISGNEALTDIILKFPFDFCAKNERN